MPITLHCPYKWYVTFDSSAWNNYNNTQRKLFVSEILMTVPKSESIHSTNIKSSAMSSSKPSNVLGWRTHQLHLEVHGKILFAKELLVRFAENVLTI